MDQSCLRQQLLDGQSGVHQSLLGPDDEMLSAIGGVPLSLARLQEQVPTATPYTKRREVSASSLSLYSGVTRESDSEPTVSLNEMNEYLALPQYLTDQVKETSRRTSRLVVNHTKSSSQI